MNEIYFVTITRHIEYSSNSYEQDYFMNSKQAQQEFIERFSEVEDLSLNEITRSGKAHFNKAGVLMKSK